MSIFRELTTIALVVVFAATEGLAADEGNESAAPAEAVAGAEAERQGAPAHSTFAFLTLPIRLNPSAAGLIGGATRRVVYHKDPNPLFDGLYVQGTLDVLLGGTFARTTAGVEWSPIRLFSLRVQYELWGWYGLHMGLGHGLSFPDANAAFGPAELQARKGEEESALGHRLVLSPTLQLKLSRLYLVDSFELGAWYIHGPESFFLEPVDDNLIRRGALDQTLKNTATVLYELGDPTGHLFRVGLMHEYFRGVASGLARQRAGAVLTYRPAFSLGAFDRLTFVAQAGVNLVDRNRQGTPWITLGARGEIDLL